MTDPHKTLYRLEVRPLTISPFKKVLIWNSKANAYDTFRLKRGNWFTAHRRIADDRAVFAGGPASSRLNDLEWVQKTAKQYKKLGFATRIVDVEVNLYPLLRGDVDCDRDVLEALQRTAQDLTVEILIASGKRTYAEQAFLYALYLAGKGNLAAKPGTSLHETGRAADCYVNGVALAAYRGGKKAAEKNGLKFPVPGELWHAQL